ncbi:MAG: SPASM domain-containing protein [Deltaproteobacteria bacterium]|nr:SPASM domain-containing protein [Deltaproteobacteria bacterium]
MFGFRLIGRLAARVMDTLWRSFPPIVRIETTNRCNAACTFCPHLSMQRETGVMDQALYEKLVMECTQGGCRTLHLHNFGEPLLDPDLAERIAFAKDAGMRRVKIFTNGSLLSGERAERLLGSGLDEIKISIDGRDAEEFARLRKGLSLDMILDNTRRFRAMRDKTAAKRRPTIIAACTQTSDRGATDRFLSSVVDRTDYGELHNWGGIMNPLQGRRIRKPCSRVWQTFTVLWNGDVALCCLDYDGSEILGNVREKPIRQVWQEERYQAIRRLHRLSEQDAIPLCQDCSKSFY